MYIKTVLNLARLYEIAENLGIVLSVRDSHVSRDGKNVINFRLFPKTKSDRYRAAGRRGRVNAVCYHGYTKFLEGVEDIDINMRNKSTMTHNKWIWGLAYGCKDKNVGSILEPISYGEKCYC